MSVRVRTLSVLLVAALTGCSLILDPGENCSDDGDCNGGTCSNGTCVGGRPLDEVDATADAEPDGVVPGDAETPSDADLDVGPADARVDVDAGRDAGPDAVPDAFRVPPRCEILEPRVDARLTAETEIEVAVVVDDPDDLEADLEITLDGQPITVDGAGHHRVLVPLDEGLNEIVLRVVDPAGQICEDRITVDSDPSPPELEVQRCPPRRVNASPVVVEGSVSDAHFDPAMEGAFAADVDGRAVPAQSIVWRNADFTATVAVRRGSNTITLRATDRLGNESEPRTCQVELDDQPPTVTITTVTADGEALDRAACSTADERITVAGRVTSDGQGEGRSNLSGGVTGPAMGQQRGLEAMPPLRADAGGHFTVAARLYMGDNEIRICGDDLALNVGCETFRCTRVDNRPCLDFGEVQDGAWVAEPMVELGGAVCAATETVTISVDGGPAMPAAVANGRWSLLVQLDGAGPHRIEGVAENGQGGRAVAVLNLNLDSSAPQVQLTSPNPNTCTNAQPIRVCGRVTEPESTIARLEANGVVGQVGVGDQFCIDVPDQIEERENYEITVRATNPAGLRGTASVRVNVDRRPPGVVMDSPPNAWLGPDANGRIVLSGRVVPGVCGVRTMTIDADGAGPMPPAAVAVQPDGAFVRRQELADGPQAVEMVINDTANNRAVVNYAFRADNTPPRITEIQPGEVVVTSEESLEICIRANDGQGSGIATVRIDNQAVVSEGGRYCRRVPVPEGETRYGIEVVDAVGNRSTEEVTVNRDVTGPQVEVDFPTNGEAVASPLIVAGRVDDGPLGSGVRAVRVSGVNQVLAEVDRFNGTWRATGVRLLPGQQDIQIVGEDDAGNFTDPPVVVSVTVGNYALGNRQRDGFSVARHVQWMGAADLNNDGRLDVIALTGRPDGASAVYLQAADGTFSGRTAQIAGLPVAAELTDAALGDLNNDGHPDLVIVGNNQNGVWLGTGDGGFRRVFDPGFRNDLSASGVTLGDINRDRTLDAIILAGESTRLLFGNGDGTFEQEPLANVDIESLITATAARLIDLDGDAVLDLVAVGAAGSQLWFGTRNSIFQEAAVDVGFQSLAGSFILPIDGDRNGTIDLFTAGDAGRFYTNAAGRFAVADLGVAWAAPLRGAVRADLDNDARDELIAFGDGGLRIWKGAAGGFVDFDQVAAGLPAVGAVRAVEVLDIDGDGDIDFLVGGADGVSLIRSNLAITQQPFRFVTLDIRRGRPGDAGPDDAVGVLVQQNLVGDMAPERAIVPHPMAPTVVSLGGAQFGDVTITYPDIGTVGMNVRTRPNIEAGTRELVEGRE